MTFILNGVSLTAKTYPTLTLGKTNLSKFHNIIENKINLNVSLKFPSDINSAVQSFVTLIQKSALDFSIVSTDINNPIKFKPQLTYEKRRTRAKFQKTHLPSYKIIYYNLSLSLKNILRKFSSEKFHECLNPFTIFNNSL